MLRVDMSNIKKYYDSKLALEIESLEIFSGDRIGVVGANGSGKTTLLNILGGIITDYEGDLNFINNSRVKYIRQIEDPENKKISREYANIFNIEKEWNESMSGGEKTLFKLAEGFEEKEAILLIDEPTSNLDLDGIELVKKNIKKYAETFLMITHDRNLLDSTCNKILQIQDGKIKLYEGNYSDYIEAKDYELVLKKVEYAEYLSKKRNLESIKEKVRKESEKINPKIEDENVRANLDDFVDTVEYRLERIDVKEEPEEKDQIRLKVKKENILEENILIQGKSINKTFEDNIIFNDLDFIIENRKKIAIVGRNGSGKSILLDMIYNREDGIEYVDGVKLGYFNEEMSGLEENKTILENIMISSVYEEDLARKILRRFLIDESQCEKKLETLSSGERVKIYFIKTILQDINVLILDEPTIHLDILGLELMEEILHYYNGTLILASHDRRFIENIVDESYIIENQKLIKYEAINYI